jgi:preprotein translocase subunit SecG
LLLEVKGVTLSFLEAFSLHREGFRFYWSAMWLLMPILTTVLVFICLLMILTILMQRPKSEGLGAAFGGGLTDNLFGAQTTTVLTKFTVWLGGLFFVLTLVISVLHVKATVGQTSIQKLLSVPAPVSSPAK